MNMRSLWVRLLIVPSVLLMTLPGCATTKAHRPDPTQDPQRQIADLQNQLMAKDQEIQDLQYQLDSSRSALPSTNFSSGSSSADRHNLLRVAGVSETDVQRALVRAGFDPGPVDGRLGKKTRSAIKSFQRKNGLTADGVVGERTWAALRKA